MRWLYWLVASVIAMGLCPCCRSLPPKAIELADLNRATVAELMRVPGMPAGWAPRIVRFRPYRTKLDLLEQGVVSQDVYARIRDGVIAHRAEGPPRRSKKQSSSSRDTR